MNKEPNGRAPAERRVRNMEDQMKRTFVFSWTAFDGTWSEMRFSGCTQQEATARAIEWGWTPPKWWQWWRFDDQPRKIPNDGGNRRARTEQTVNKPAYPARPVERNVRQGGTAYEDFMNDEQIEQEIQKKGLTAPRITSDRIDAIITGEDYHVFPGTTVTVCILKLENGFTVTGESACASPENFDAELGRKIARTQARDKIWALEGYVLRQKLHEAA